MKIYHLCEETIRTVFKRSGMNQDIFGWLFNVLNMDEVGRNDRDRSIPAIGQKIEAALKKDNIRCTVHKKSSYALVFVFEKDPNHVYKISYRDNAYSAFVLHVKSNNDNPYYPRISNVITLSDGIMLVKMENLNNITDESLKNLIIKLDESMYNRRTGYDENDQGIDAFETIFKLAKSPKSKKEAFREFYIEVVKLLKQFKGKCYMDLSTSNVMMRGDQPVFIDPVIPNGMVNEETIRSIYKRVGFTDDIFHQLTQALNAFEARIKSGVTLDDIGHQIRSHFDNQGIKCIVYSQTAFAIVFIFYDKQPDFVYKLSFRDQAYDSFVEYCRENTTNSCLPKIYRTLKLENGIRLTKMERLTQTTNPPPEVIKRFMYNLGDKELFIDEAMESNWNFQTFINHTRVHLLPDYKKYEIMFHQLYETAKDIYKNLILTNSNIQYDLGSINNYMMRNNQIVITDPVKTSRSAFNEETFNRVAFKAAGVANDQKTNIDNYIKLLQMVVNDFEKQRSSPNSISNQSLGMALSKYLNDKGCKVFYFSSFSIVFIFDGDPNHVYKIAIRDPAYAAFAQYCKQDPDNPCLPEIKKSIGLYPKRGIVLYKIEKLTPVSDGLYQEFINLLSLNRYRSFDEIWNHLENYFGDSLNNIDKMKTKSMLENFYQTFLDIKKELRRYNTDLNPDNIMMRGEQLVILDPVYESN